MHGRIDLVYRRDGKLYAADFRTDKMGPAEGDPQIRRVYAEVVGSLFKETPIVRVFPLKGAKVDS